MDMRYGRKICKELFVILYVFIFLVSDPKLVRACSMIILPDTSKETITSDDVTFDFLIHRIRQSITLYMR